MNDLPQFIIYFFGNHGVGKTALNYKINFGDSKKKIKLNIIFEPTKSPQFSTKIINNKYKLILVDFPGDSQSANSYNYQDAAGGICLIYDISNTKSFQELKEKWIPILKEKNMINGNNDKNKILVIANKNDLYHNKDYSEFVEKEQGEEFAKEIGAGFLSFSVVNEDDKVDKILNYFEEGCNLNNLVVGKDKKNEGVGGVKDSCCSCICF